MVTIEASIRLRDLPTGQQVVGETANHVFYKLRSLGEGLFEVESSYPGLHNPTLGQLIGSGELTAGGTLSFWFAGGRLNTGPWSTATVTSAEWNYKVF